MVVPPEKNPPAVVVPSCPTLEFVLFLPSTPAPAVLVTEKPGEALDVEPP